HHGGTFFCLCEVCPNQRRSQKIARRCPGGLDPLVAEKWTVAGDAFRPAFDSFAMGGHQQHTAALDTAEAGLKKILQRHAKFAEGDGFDFHDLLALGARSCCCSRCLACCQSDSSSSMVACCGVRPPARSCSSIH